MSDDRLFGQIILGALLLFCIWAFGFNAWTPSLPEPERQEASVPSFPEGYTDPYEGITGPWDTDPCYGKRGDERARCELGQDAASDYADEQGNEEP